MNDKANFQEPGAPEVNFGINADENMSGTNHLNEPVANESDIEKLQEELQEMKDKYLRKVAEFDNFRKRSSKEKMELLQMAGKEVITDLLDVLDDCARAEKQMSDSNNINQVKDGVQLVFSKLKNLLASK
jgi:molecular chaperone GrpE